MSDFDSAAATVEAHRLRVLYDRTASRVAEARVQADAPAPAPTPERAPLPEWTAADAERMCVVYDKMADDLTKRRLGAPVAPTKKLAEPLPAQALAARPHSVR